MALSGSRDGCADGSLALRGAAASNEAGADERGDGAELRSRRMAFLQAYGWQGAHWRHPGVAVRLATRATHLGVLGGRQPVLCARPNP